VYAALIWCSASPSAASVELRPHDGTARGDGGGACRAARPRPNDSGTWEQLNG
jgi:hypothetical protein